VENFQIPEIVAKRALNIVSILDKYYGVDRNIDKDNGGYLLIFTDCLQDVCEIQRLLDKYHV